MISTLQVLKLKISKLQVIKINDKYTTSFFKIMISTLQVLKLMISTLQVLHYN